MLILNLWTIIWVVPRMIQKWKWRNEGPRVCLNSSLGWNLLMTKSKQTTRKSIEVNATYFFSVLRHMEKTITAWNKYFYLSQKGNEDEWIKHLFVMHLKITTIVKIISSEINLEQIKQLEYLNKYFCKIRLNCFSFKLIINIRNT